MGVGVIRGSLRRFLLVGAGTIAILVGMTSTASAAFSVTPTRSFPIGTFQFGGYAPGFDGTFWTVATGENSGGSVGHVDDEGHNLGDGFNINDSAALGIAYYGGRVYIPVGSSYSQRIVSYNTSGGDFLHADSETGQRIGSNQVILRAYPNGLGTVGFGQNNKVATMNLASNVAAHPWYPMAFHGNGVNDPIYDSEVGNAFETCSLSGEGIVIGEPDPYCGKYGYTDPGGLNSKHPGFNYAIDTAPGLGGLYVAELYNDRVTHINTVANPGAIIDFTFGGSGSGASQLSRPYSVVVQPGTNDVFVSEQSNFRISVFDAGGHYIASFGYGVLDGSDTMQVCGVEIGPCRAGISYLTDPRSYFTRLDFGPEGELLAYTAADRPDPGLLGGRGPGVGRAGRGRRSGPWRCQKSRRAGAARRQPDQGEERRENETDGDRQSRQRLCRAQGPLPGQDRPKLGQPRPGGQTGQRLQGLEESEGDRQVRLQGRPHRREQSGDPRLLAQSHREAQVVPSLRVIRPPRRSFLPRRSTLKPRRSVRLFQGVSGPGN